VDDAIEVVQPIPLNLIAGGQLLGECIYITSLRKCEKCLSNIDFDMATCHDIGIDDNAALSR
jgi:hypothetical protein